MHEHTARLPDLQVEGAYREVWPNGLDALAQAHCPQGGPPLKAARIPDAAFRLLNILGLFLYRDVALMVKVSAGHCNATCPLLSCLGCGGAACA